MEQSRKDRVDKIIESGNVNELLSLVEHGPCACLGAIDGEPLCRCKMTAKQVRDAVSYAGLKRGVLSRIKLQSGR